MRERATPVNPLLTTDLITGQPGVKRQFQRPVPVTYTSQWHQRKLLCETRLPQAELRRRPVEPNIFNPPPHIALVINVHYLPRVHKYAFGCVGGAVPTSPQFQISQAADASIIAPAEARPAPPENFRRTPRFTFRRQLTNVVAILVQCPPSFSIPIIRVKTLMK
jgi:hypothetical protein